MATTLQTTESGHSVRAIHERLNSGPSDGVEVVTLTNKSVSVRICPTRGMGILDATFDGVRVGWDSPVNGPVHPALVNLESRNKLGWLDGFTELFVRCGLAFMGPPGPDEHAGPIVGDITLHGRIANTPAQSVEIECHDDVAIVRGVVEETVLFGPKLQLTTEIRLTAEGQIKIRDEVTNLGKQEAEYQLLYHINVGPPILAEGSRVVVDRATKICPRDPRASEDINTWDTCLAPTTGYAEQAYFFVPDASKETTRASLHSPNGAAFHVDYPTKALPSLTLWKCTQELEAGYVIGLEPGTGFPNHKSFERRHNRVPTLQGGESAVKELTLSLETDGQIPDAANTEAHLMRVPDEPLAVRPE